MAIGPSSLKHAFPLAFVQQLLTLSDNQHTKFVSHLEQLLDIQASIIAFNADYKHLSTEQLKAEHTYNKAVAADCGEKQAQPSPGTLQAQLKYDATTKEFCALSTTVESIKDKMKGFFPLEAIEKLFADFSPKKPNQTLLNKHVAIVNTLVLGTASESEILDKCKTINESRKEALRVFLTARVLYTKNLSASDKKIQEIIKKVNMTPAHVKELRSFCQHLTDADLYKICGKADPEEFSAFLSLIEASKTKVDSAIMTLTNVLGNNLDALRNLTIELIERTSEAVEKNDSYVPFLARTPIPRLVINEANKKTLRTLIDAFNKPDPALKTALIKLGNTALLDLLQMHLADENADYRITSEIPLDQLVLALAHAFHNASPSQSIPPVILEKLIADTEDKSAAVSTLKAIKKALQEYKTGDKTTPITLNLPWSIYHPRVICQQLGISTFSAGCAATALIGYGIAQLDVLGSSTNFSLIAAPLTALTLKTTYQYRANMPEYHQCAERTGVCAQFYDKLEGFCHTSKATPVVRALKSQEVELSLHSGEPNETAPVESPFKRATGLTIFDVTKPDDIDSAAYKVHVGIKMIFSPIVNLFKICNEKIEGFFGSEEDSSRMINHLCKTWNMDRTSIANCSTMAGHLEALFNWGGRIPYVCAITGMWRVTMGLVISVAASLLGLWTIAFSKNEETALIGRSILRHYTLKQGLGNITRGIFESSSWAISILTNLPRDLLGIRWSYEGEETASSMHLTPMFRELINNVPKKLEKTG